VKKKRGVLLLLAITIIVSAYAYLIEYKKRTSDDEQKEKEALVIKFDRDAIDQISITNAQQVVLSKKENKWKITSPVEDDVDEMQVKSLLDSIAKERADMEIGDELMEPKIYGLDKPLATIEVHSGGESTKIEVGGEALQGKNYLRVNSAKGIIVSSSQWKYLAEKSIKDLRSRLILRSHDVQSVEVHVKGQKPFLLKQNDKKWVIEGARFNLDTPTVHSFIAQIENLRAMDVEAENQRQLSKYGLDQPAVVLRVVSKDNKDPVVIGLSGPRNNNKDSFVTNSTLKPIFKSYGELSKSFVKKPLDFRDRREPFQYSLAEVVGVRTKSSLFDFRFIKKGEAWYLEKPDEKRDVDQAQLVSLLTGLQEIRVQEYLGAVPFKAQRTIELLDKNGDVLLKLEIGDQVKGRNRRLAKSSKLGEVFAVDQALVDAWPGQTLVKEKAQNSTKKEP